MKNICARVASASVAPLHSHIYQNTLVMHGTVGQKAAVVRPVFAVDRFKLFPTRAMTFRKGSAQLCSHLEPNNASGPLVEPA
jgi:hypothetical protein